MDTPRLFRRIFSAAYWTFTLGLGASLAISITVEAFNASDDATAAGMVDAKGCLTGFEGLHQQLTTRFQEAMAPTTGDAPSVKGARWKSWETWSGAWEIGLHQHRARCGAQFAEAEEMEERLSRLHLAYSTALRGFTAVGERELIKAEQAFIDARK